MFLSFNSTDSKENVGQHRRRWTADEDQFLRDQISQYDEVSNPVDWASVSRGLSNRSNKDCRKRWLKIDTKWNQGVWAPAEDERLQKAVEQCQNRWKAVSDIVQSRNPDQCAKRWRNSLDPNILRYGWSPADDTLLLTAVAEVGRNWKIIASSYFPSRSRLDLSNRYTMLTRRRRASTQTQTIACLENAASYSTVPQATGFALLTPPGEKDVATQSRSHSYGWPGSIGYDQNPLVLASEGREDKTHAESSVVPGCDEQASVYHYQCGSWGQHSFGDQVFADNPSLGLSTYPSQNIFLQSLYDSYPSQEGTSTSVKVESSSTSSIHSFPAYAETETQFPVPKVGKAEQPTSQHSGSTINLDNLDSLTRAAVLDLIRNGNK